jgi:hypothetical protein
MHVKDRKATGGQERKTRVQFASSDEVTPALFTTQQAPVLAILPAYDDTYDSYVSGVDHGGSAAIIDEIRVG